MAIIILAGLTSQALGVAVSAGAPNEKVALAIAPSITVILILFGGFYANAETSECSCLLDRSVDKEKIQIPKPTNQPTNKPTDLPLPPPPRPLLFPVPDWLSWIKYLSHLFFGFSALTINNFSGQTGWTCPPVNGVVPPLSECETTGDEILVTLGFTGVLGELWFAIVGLLYLLVGFNLLGYVLLRRSKPKFMPLGEAEVRKHGKKA